MSRTSRFAALAVLALVVAAPAMAGRNNTNVRSSARTNVNQNTNVNRNSNVNVNQNRNVNANVNRNVNVDVNTRGGYGYGGSGCCYHPGAVAAGAAAGAAVGVAIGSSVNTLPPACSAVVVNGFTYQQCGSTWYQPQISGSSSAYVVVSPPR